jgi:hypothetical protein
MGPAVAIAAAALATAGGPGTLVHTGDGYALYAQRRERRSAHACLTRIERDRGKTDAMRACFNLVARPLRVAFFDRQCLSGGGRLIGLTSTRVARLNLAVGSSSAAVHLYRIPARARLPGLRAFSVRRELAGRTARLTAYDRSGRRIARRKLGPFGIAQCAAPPVP